ncbi:hypothetical protein [Streptomyces sp. Rer75]|nr:hypothetical protein [Streptomyces sp. Rer75]
MEIIGQGIIARNVATIADRHPHATVPGPRAFEGRGATAPV